MLDARQIKMQLPSSMSVEKIAEAVEKLGFKRRLSVRGVKHYARRERAAKGCKVYLEWSGRVGSKGEYLYDMDGKHGICVFLLYVQTLPAREKDPVVEVTPEEKMKQFERRIASLERKVG